MGIDDIIFAVCAIAVAAVIPTCILVSESTNKEHITVTQKGIAHIKQGKAEWEEQQRTQSVPIFVTPKSDAPENTSTGDWRTERKSWTKEYE